MFLPTPNPKQIQPIIKHKPPNGVIGPTHFNPGKTKASL